MSTPAPNVNPNLLPDDEYVRLRDLGNFDYSGTCPGCGLAFIEGQQDNGEDDGTNVEPWTLGWCEGCVHH